MNSYSRIVLCLFVLVVFAGVTSAKVSKHDIYVMDKVPRPDHILVYDFAATPADIPADSALAGQVSQPPAPQTARQIEAGRELGAQIAAKLVEQIRGMGLPAERASAQTTPQINDIIVRGYLVSIEEGSAEKRVGIGFGAGNAVLKTAVEGFQMTAQGLRKLGVGKVDSGGGKTPGTVVTGAMAVATGNPLGLIVSTGVKVHGEKSGKSKLEGKADQTAKEIAGELKKRFQKQGWIK